MKKLGMKLAGGILGIVFILFAVQLTINPLFDTISERTSIFSAAVLGVVFIRYAIVGSSRKNP
ncbi:MAG: hypothetical protein AB1921_02715 [Thermodesulfobacteriota bacterium]